MAGKATLRSLISRRSLRALALLPFLLAASQSTLDPAQNLAGRYYRQFPDAFVSGEKYTGQDIVEIVPVARGAAYVRIELDFYNGHSCSIYGVAQSEGEALVYHDPGFRFANRSCVLTIKREGKSLWIDDGENSCQGHCGARGALSRVSLPYSSKRPIRYMPRLRASQEYRWALDEWRTGTPIREQWKKEMPPSRRKPEGCAAPCPM